jgi:MscS family membrane protein
MIVKGALPMQNINTQFIAFWNIFLDVWKAGLFGYSIGDVLLAAGIFLVFYTFRGMFTKVVLGALRRWVAKSKTTIDDQVVDVLAGPVRLLFVVLGIFFALNAIDLKGMPNEFANKLVRSLIAYVIFWGLYNSIEPLKQVLKRLEKVLSVEMVSWVVTGTRWALVAVGAATILQMWGIQVAPIIAGLGLFGVAVALGAQDLFKNLIGGLCILIEKRFHNGDWILAEGVVEGTVEHIGFRSTMVRRFDASPVYVPNQKLSDNAVTNFSNMTYRRINWTINLEYRTTLEQLRTIRDQVELYLTHTPDFVQPPKASLFVRIDKFGPSSIDLMIYTFTYTKVWGEWLICKENLAYEIKKIVENAGAGFAFPSQSVYVESLPDTVSQGYLPTTLDIK